MRARAACAVVAVVLTAACTSAEGSKKTAVTTTSVPASNAEADLARAALFDAVDVGAGWSVHARAKGDDPPRGDDCAHRPEGPLSQLAPGASQLGTSFQLDDERAYLYSSSL